MTEIRFRNYICPGLSKKDDDNLARTSAAYLRLELISAFCVDAEEAVEEETNKQTPQAPR